LPHVTKISVNANIHGIEQACNARTSLKDPHHGHVSAAPSEGAGELSTLIASLMELRSGEIGHAQEPPATHSDASHEASCKRDATALSLHAPLFTPQLMVQAAAAARQTEPCKDDHLKKIKVPKSFKAPSVQHYAQQLAHMQQWQQAYAAQARWQAAQWQAYQTAYMAQMAQWHTAQAALQAQGSPSQCKFESEEK